MGEFIKVSEIDEMKNGTMKAVNVAGHQILLARVKDKYYAVDNLCPHKKGNLSQGKLEGIVVTCPLHGSQFDVSNGRVVRWLKGGLMSKISNAIKLSKALTVHNVKVEGNAVSVEI